MEWQKTYPNLATAMAASFETLGTWRERRCDAVTENKHEELDFAKVGLVDLPPSISFFPPTVRKQSRVRVSV